MRWLILIACLWNPAVAFAHSGHNHGGETASAPAEAEPRFSSSGTHVTLVGILKAGRLWLHADDPASNAPIDALHIDVDAHGIIERAVPHNSQQDSQRGTQQGSQYPGTYSVPADGLALPGKHALVVTVQSAAYTELLTATLTVPASAEPVASGSAPLSWDKALSILLVGCLVLYLAWRQARAATQPFILTVVLGSVGLCSVLLSSAYIVYNTTSVAAVVPGIPIQPAASAAEPDTRPRRLPDGATFIPKPAQTLLQLRTLPVHPQRLPRSLTLPGRIVNDPQSTVVVQAEQAGRLSPPAHGFPLPGTRVKKGELLAHLQPVVSSLDGARQRAELAALEKDLYLNQRQTERLLAQLGTQNTTANVSLEVGRAEQAALQRRIELLRAALAVKLPMTAPVDGVIGEANALNGAVVPAGGQVFSIVDPTRFWMQALALPDMDTTQISSAQAVLHDGRSFPLAFAGHGYQLNNQALPLRFRPLAAMPALMVGTLLDIRLQTRDTVDGVRLPRTAVLPSADAMGATVWVRTAAERFEPRRVEIQSVDEHTVLAVKGLQPGDRVVDNGSTLLSMIQSAAP
ncbi:MAG: efflux RND transporter periplasmic adaptor subunit [Gammaproteobacteria bacterium]|nr:efflux RND transporter periplasmic adaptor subunit [Gammaproteobacteria bacterium]